jgi:hypothetical protein
MKRVKTQHLPNTTNVVDNGTLSANLHIDILRTIVLDYSWSPKTHLSLVSTCKSFQTWIMNLFFKRCMFDVSDLPQEDIGLIHIDVSSCVSKEIVKKHNIMQRYMCRIPLLGCLSLIKMFLNNRNQLGPIRTAIIHYLIYRHISYMKIITDAPITVNTIMFEYFTHVTQDKVGYDTGGHGNVFARYFNPLHLPNDIRDPYPAWRLMSKYVKAWTDKLVIPTGPCPELYQRGVMTVLRKIIKTHETNGTTYKILWKKLQLCMDISTEAFECVRTLVGAKMFQISISWVVSEAVSFDGFETLLSRTLDVFPEERLAEMLECKNYALGGKAKLLDETLARHVTNNTVPHGSIIRFVNICLTANEQLVDPAMLRVCEKYAVPVIGKYPRWGIMPLK